MYISYITIYTLLQIPIFYGFWYYYSTHKQFQCSCKKFKETFPLAKASASLINYNLTILIISSIRIYKHYVYIPLHFKNLHYISVFFVYIWSIIHSIAHYLNFKKLLNPPYFTWGVGFTGHVLLTILFVFFIFSLPFFRKFFFHKFIVSHMLFYLSFMSFLYIHQTFCFIKTDSNTCPLPLSWLWYSLPLCIYLLEICYKYIFTVTQLVKYQLHSSDIIELQFLNSNIDNITGKIIWICCTHISPFEWHPFAITSLNHTNSTFSVIIKNRGNWTNKLSQLLFFYTKPRFLIHGPFINIPRNLISKVQNNPSVFISSGIGITSFSSIFFKLLTTRLCCPLHTIIIVKHPNEIAWILELLQTVSQYNSPFLSFTFFFTDTSIVNLDNFPFNYSIGRPDLKYELSKPIIHTNFDKYKHIYLYHSGRKNISIQLSNLCKKHKLYIYNDIK